MLTAQDLPRKFLYLLVVLAELTSLVVGYAAVQVIQTTHVTGSSVTSGQIADCCLSQTHIFDRLMHAHIALAPRHPPAYPRRMSGHFVHVAALGSVGRGGGTPIPSPNRV